MRTGDTTQSERAAMLRTPPHILVTTPESLYLLLTAERSREMLRTVRTVIVDEIHAVIGTRRGAHLALSLERLEAWCAGAGRSRRLQRIGLSATQKPIDEVARFLVGASADRGDCTIVDEGHRREIDLAVELPRSPLEAVMSHEVWEEYYDRLAELIGEHRTTLVFVNTRRMAERVARHLSERLGEDAVTAHHGSLSKERRLDAEHRLKTGTLKALVATASLELGIDIGHVDLVCQIGSPHRIATLLQRVGRSGHTIGGTPKGRLFPVSRDDLVECAALLRAVRVAASSIASSRTTRRSTCSRSRSSPRRRVATTARTSCSRSSAARGRTASSTRADFDAVVAMVADGFATPRGRRAALVHRDEVNRRAPRPARLAHAGAHLGRRDSRGRRLPRGARARGHVHRHAERGLRHREHGRRHLSARQRVVADPAGRAPAPSASRDAHGAPPTIPFWLGEAPARSDELSRAVSDLRARRRTRT